MKNPMRDAIKNRRIQMVQGRELINVDPLEQEQDAILKRKEPKDQNLTDENDDEDSASVIEDKYNSAESPEPPYPEPSSEYDSNMRLTPEEIARVKMMLAKMDQRNPDQDEEPTSIHDRMLIEQYKKQGG